MRIGILLCDHVDPERVAVAGGDYGQMYRRFVTSIDPDLDVSVFDVVNGQVPDSTSECDGWIITGSRFSAYDDEPWIADLLAFIRQLDEQQSKTVGICFGHQAVALALGGEVEPAGWKVGVQTMTVVPQPWAPGGPVRLHAMHQDVVTRLPPSAVSIADGTTATIPAFTIGDHILTVQDHPEYDEHYERALIESRRDRIGDDLTDAALRSLGGSTDGAIVAAWIVEFFNH